MARIVKAHLRARRVMWPGENEEHERCRGCIPLGPPWIAEAAHQIYVLELEDAKRRGHNSEDEYLGRMVNTSEYCNDHGECGPEVRIGHDGRVTFVKGSVYLPDKPPVKVRLEDYSRQYYIKFKGGKRKVDTQLATTARVKLKPGPKPIFEVAMDKAARKAKQRCEKKGIPFVLAEYLEKRKGRERKTHDHKS